MLLLGGLLGDDEGLCPEDEEGNPACEAMYSFEVIMEASTKHGICPYDDKEEHRDEDIAGHDIRDWEAISGFPDKVSSCEGCVKYEPDYSGNAAPRMDSAIVIYLGKLSTDEKRCG